MLTLRKRGRFWHVRGSVRIGKESRRVQEHSTGCDRKEDAEAYQSRLEGELRHELLYGVGKRTERMTVADAGLRYVNRPGGVKSYDLWRLDQLNEVMGDYSVGRAAEGWSEFKGARCGGLAHATVERFRAVLQAVLNYAAAEEQFESPKIRRTDRIHKKRIRFLSKEQQELLLGSYAPHVRPIAVALCFQGLRIGEALRLDWVHVDWGANSLFILPETKNGEGRAVTMHPRVRKELHRLYVDRGRPKQGRVFLNRVGKPYARPPQVSPPRRLSNQETARYGLQTSRDQ
jgi:integrase